VRPRGYASGAFRGYGLAGGLFEQPAQRLFFRSSSGNLWISGIPRAFLVYVFT